MRKFVEKILESGFQGLRINAQFDHAGGKGVIGVRGLRLSETPIRREVHQSFHKNRKILGPQRKKLEEEIRVLAAQARVALGKIKVNANVRSAKYPSNFDFYAATEPLNEHQFNFHIEELRSLLTRRGIRFTHEHSLKIADKT